MICSKPRLSIGNRGVIGNPLNLPRWLGSIINDFKDQLVIFRMPKLKQTFINSFPSPPCWCDSQLMASEIPGTIQLPRRWVVEKNIAWLNQLRRLSKSYERLTRIDEIWIYIAMTRIMLNRLA